MKNYKEFQKIHIGSSGIASLTLRSCGNVAPLDFGEDGSYSAYECFGDVAIGEHYEKVFSGESWLKIFDDDMLRYDKRGGEYKHIDIYRAGEMGCIIHWHC